MVADAVAADVAVAVLLLFLLLLLLLRLWLFLLLLLLLLMLCGWYGDRDEYGKTADVDTQRAAGACPGVILTTSARAVPERGRGRATLRKMRARGRDRSRRDACAGATWHRSMFLL